MGLQANISQEVLVDFQKSIQFMGGHVNDFEEFKIDVNRLTGRTGPKASTMQIPVKKYGSAVKYTGTYEGTGDNYDVEYMEFGHDINNVSKMDPKVYGGVKEDDRSIVMSIGAILKDDLSVEVPKLLINTACAGAGRKVVVTDAELTPSGAYELFTTLVSKAVNTDKNVVNDYSTRAEDLVCFMSDRFHALLKEANKSNSLTIVGATPRIENNCIKMLDGVEIRVQDNGIMYDAFEFDSRGVFNPKTDAKELELLIVPRNKEGLPTLFWDIQLVDIVNTKVPDAREFLRGYSAILGAKLVNMRKANVITLVKGDTVSDTVVASVAATGRTPAVKVKDALIE